jgi:hypothetical protein
MKITRNVIMDLLPVYFSGEANPDTNDLIEEFLRQNPEFSSVVEAQKREFAAQHELFEPASVPSADHELRTLERTRSLMERHKWQMAVALMLTAFPFSFVANGGHLTFIVVRDQPVLAAASWFGAAVLWMLCLRARRRLRMAGL